MSEDWRAYTSKSSSRNEQLWQDRLIAKDDPMKPIRLILWTLALAYGGSFLFADKTVRSFHDASAIGALIGATLGLLLGVMFEQRARRRHI
ncbi:MAG: hypothetical protein C5B58_12480 [Acidobacteria bacterium]|nr:MAG: hypothetical protein C5B58_12480 [Acidobacteriota bacterium]